MSKNKIEENLSENIEKAEGILEKEKKKKNPKSIANWSLLLMGAGFASTIPFTSNQGMELLHGGFEAGLVGGIADWFAVTALFKHPLNIPIPHTALLPKNRKKITKGILSAIEKELLNKEILFEKMKNIHFTDMAIQKIEEYIETEEFDKLVKEIKKNAVSEFEKNEFEEVKKEIVKIIKEKEKEFKTDEVFGKVIDKIIENKIDEKVLDEVISLIENKYQEEDLRKRINETVISAVEKKAENGFLKLALAPILALGKEKIDATIESTIEEAIQDLKNEKSSTRFKVKKTIKLEIVSLKENEELVRKIEEKREEFLSEEMYQTTVEKALETAKKELIKKVENDNFEHYIKEKIKSLINNIKENEETKEKIENKIKDVIGKTIENNHEKIGMMIEENMEKMSNEQITGMIEDKVGKELAWIRVNGALCGFVIGLGLTGIKMLLG